MLIKSGDQVPPPPIFKSPQLQPPTSFQEKLQNPGFSQSGQSVSYELFARGCLQGCEGAGAV